MDKAEIKRQISYWEGMLKEGEKLVKVQQDQNQTIKSTLKALRSLLPKEDKQEVPDDLQSGYRIEEQ